MKDISFNKRLEDKEVIDVHIVHQGYNMQKSRLDSF